ncbi:MAG TPA: hypothetical protein VMU32_10905 [Solirubrobacteraceae bacterium]|nr:hypothetical protein [Solirubrobacteraceae bacterium]
MTATIAPDGELRQFEELVAGSSHELLQALSQTPIPADYVDRWQHTASRLSDAINRSVPPSLDAEQVAEIRGELLKILQQVADGDPARPLDSVETALLGLEAIRHIVRDALDRQAPGTGDARALLLGLQETLPRVGRRELAELLGVSERSIQRILASPTPVAPDRRLELLAGLVALLRRGWTPEGVVAWFKRPRPELAGRSPLEAIDDPESEQAIFELARHGRAEHGS